MQHDPSALAELAASAGLRRVHLLAWRDLDDPDAGGSEVHAATVCRLWAEAGLEVTMRTSAAVGLPPVAARDGYRVVRRAGRYSVFPRAAVSEALRRTGPYDGLVEIWNGMPFLSPLWARGPRSVWVHHVHGEMWRMMLPPGIAHAGELLEARLAPPLYRGTRVVTLSESSRRELVEELGLRHVSVVPPGIDPRFSPGGDKATRPLVVAVGRLAPVKRFDVLVEVLARLHERHPALQAVIVGEGDERQALEARVAALGAGEWLQLPGRLADDELVALYRRAWVVTSASAREGWGMTITEAAACGTPSVVTRISGHRDAVAEGRSGLLADGERELLDGLDRVLGDGELRRRLAAGALDHARTFTWAATARGTLEALVADARARARR